MTLDTAHLVFGQIISCGPWSVHVKLIVINEGSDQFAWVGIVIRSLDYLKSELSHTLVDFLSEYVESRDERRDGDCVGPQQFHIISFNSDPTVLSAVRQETGRRTCYLPARVLYNYDEFSFREAIIRCRCCCIIAGVSELILVPFYPPPLSTMTWLWPGTMSE